MPARRCERWACPCRPARRGPRPSWAAPSTRRTRPAGPIAASAAPDAVGRPVPFWQAALLSLALLALFLGGWEMAARSGGSSGAAVDPEYAALLGQAAASGGQTPFPKPSEIGARLWELLRDPFYVRGTNDQGIGVQVAYSLLRVAAGFGL